MDNSPWKTPFGKLLIGSSIVAAVIGFALAAGLMTYVRGAAAAPDDAVVAGENAAADDALEGAPEDPSLAQGYAEAQQQEQQEQEPATQAAAVDEYYPATAEADQEATPADSDDRASVANAGEAYNSADQEDDDQ